MLLLAPSEEDPDVVKFIMSNEEHEALRRNYKLIEKELKKAKITGELERENKAWYFMVRAEAQGTRKHVTMRKTAEKFARRIKKKGYLSSEN